MIIYRIPTDNSDGTFGVMVDGVTAFAVTLERPWAYNKRNISCIPAGQYECQRVKSPRFDNTFQVMNVEGRSHILFHKGNIDDDTHGCIIIGEQFGTLNGKDAVLASRKGFNEFMDRLKGQNLFPLTIVGDQGVDKYPLQEARIEAWRKD